VKVVLPSHTLLAISTPIPHHPLPSVPPPYHGPHADRTDTDYYDSSEDIMKMDEGADSRLARQYEIVMTQIP